MAQIKNIKNMPPQKIWLDDVRPAPKGYFHAWNYDSAICLIEYFSRFGNGIELISFDHDLGERKSGYDVAKYIVENDIKINRYKVHSANPVGRFNIEQLLDHYGYEMYTEPLCLEEEYFL
jgi:hypothetical protein